MSIYTYLSIIYLDLIYAKIKTNGETELCCDRNGNFLGPLKNLVQSTAAKGNISLHSKQPYIHRGVCRHQRKLIPNSFSNSFLLLSSSPGFSDTLKRSKKSHSFRKTHCGEACNIKQPHGHNRKKIKNEMHTHAETRKEPEKQYSKLFQPLWHGGHT